MSHHSSDDTAPDPILRSLMERSGNPIGPTGQHPRGHLTPTDEGGIRIAVGAKDNAVVIDFGKPIAWIGFTPDEADQIAESLRKHAAALRARSPR